MENKSLTPKEQRQVLWRLLSYMKLYKQDTMLAFILLVLATAGELIGPYLVKIFIDDYLTPQRLDFEPLFWLSAAYIGVLLLKTIISYFQLVKFQELALKVIQALRMDVFTKVHELGMRYFDQTPGGSIVSRVTNDTEAIKDMFVSVLAAFIQNGVFVIGVFIAMFALNVQLAVYCLFILPVIIWIMKLYRHYSSIFYKDMRERLSELNAKLNESLQGMAVIQVFRQQKRLREEFSQINDKHYAAGMKNIKIDGLLLRPAIDFVYIVSIMVVLSFFGISAMESPVEIGVLYAFVNYLERFFEPVTQMMMRFPYISRQSFPLHAYLHFLIMKSWRRRTRKNRKHRLQKVRLSFAMLVFRMTENGMCSSIFRLPPNQVRPLRLLAIPAAEKARLLIC